MRCVIHTVLPVPAFSVVTYETVYGQNVAEFEGVLTDFAANASVGDAMHVKAYTRVQRRKVRCVASPLDRLCNLSRLAQVHQWSERLGLSHRAVRVPHDYIVVCKLAESHLILSDSDSSTHSDSSTYSDSSTHSDCSTHSY
jgi:hypothetical protein